MALATTAGDESPAVLSPWPRLWALWRGGWASAPELIATVFGRWEELVGSSVATHVRPVVWLAARSSERRSSRWGHANPTSLRPEILERVASEFGAEGAPVRLEIRVRA